MAVVMTSSSPAKRTVPNDDDGSDRLRHPIKRVKKEIQQARQSHEANATPSGPDDDARTDSSSAYSSDDDDGEADDGESMDGDPGEQYDLEETMAAYQQSHAQRQYATEMSEAGYIKSVSLVDFMCHRNLTLDFGAQMNFLVGHNGSGKSAILTGIAIALGGKSANTGRGQSMKDLIRKGADKAVITVTIANEGELAYRQEVYPKNIFIERTISKSGASTFAFRAVKDGKIIANKKEELNRILDVFQIHVDSPLTILTQDKARSFLQSSDPGSLYTFFMHGTLLQNLVDAYGQLKISIQTLRRTLRQERESLPELKGSYDRLLRQQRANDRLLEMKAEYDQLGRELGWAFVHRKELELEKEEEKVQTQRLKIEQAKQRILDTETSVQTAGEQIKELQMQIEAMNDNEAPYTAQRNQLRTKLEIAKKDILKISDECKACQNSIEECGREVALYDQRIKEKESISAGSDPAVARLRQEIEKHLDMLSNLRRQKPKTEQDWNDACKSLDDAETAEETAKSEALNAKKLETEHANLIENLKMQAQNRSAAFGERMDIVLREIDRAKWRHSKPIGPLGLHVKLADKRYQNAFHRVMGSTLCQFAVRCEEDRRTMMDILTRCQRQGYKSGHTRGRPPPSVIWHAGDRFDYTSGDLSHLNETILSKLEFDNEDVKRILINAHSIERTFVWPQINGATGVNQRIRELLRDGQNACNFVTADGFNARGTHSTEQSGPLPRYDGNILLVHDAATNIESLRVEHAGLTATANEAMAKHQSTIDAKRRAMKDKAALTTRLEKVTSGITKFEEKIAQLRDQLAEKEVVDQGEDLAGAREDALRRRRGAEEQLAMIQEQQGQYNATKDKLDASLKEMQAELDTLAPERTRTSEALTLLAQTRSKAVQDIDHFHVSVKRYTVELQSLEQRKALVKDEVQSWTESSMQTTPNGIRVHTTRNPDDVERQRNAMAKTIKDAEKERGVSMDDITVRVSDAEKRLKNKEHDVSEMRKLVRLCNKVLSNREKFWVAERTRLAIQANCVFITASEKRDLNGELMFDHNMQKLHIKVREMGLHTQGISAAYKTPQTMSGGERSFITVSLLLSMWALSQCPIRCLDEWDVFLDHANRKVAANMLLDGARDNSLVQHLLITPQDMSGIEVKGQGSKIIKMADPIRNQGTLPF